MRITYSPDSNIAYIRFTDVTAEVETRSLSDSVAIDFAPDGSIHGIELLNANEQLRAGDDGHLVSTDPTTGTERRVKLVAARGDLERVPIATPAAPLS